MKIIERKTKKTIDLKDSCSLRFLYNTKLGRIILKLFIGKKASILFGKLTNTKLSKLFIKRFIKKHNINIEEYEEKEYKSFNDFFIRKIKKGKRPFDNKKEIFPSVADSNLTAYQITKDLKLKIKNSIYDVEELIKDKNKLEKYNNGICLVFRLCADNYHRYIYPDNGTLKKTYHIEGLLHTVQPIALSRYKVFIENDREVSILKTENFGDIAYIEVGALNVGKIHNTSKKSFKKGEEKGYFSFGGSTIILLIEKDKIKVDEDIIKNTKEDIETKVLQGESIAKRY